MKKQQGLSVVSILIVMAVIGVVILLGFKILPVYTEYSEVRKAITSLAAEQGKGEFEIRKEFNNRAAVNDISSINATDLVVVTGADFVFIRAKYRREVPLFSNVSLVFDFDTQAGKPAP